MLVRLYHAYPGIDPFAVPGWTLDILVRGLPFVDARQLRQMALAAKAGWAVNSDFEKIIRSLNRIIEPVRDVTPAVLPANEKARAWFISQGIPVSGEA